VTRPARVVSQRRRALLRLSLVMVVAVALATMAWTALAGMTRGAAVCGMVAAFATLATLAFEIVIRLWSSPEQLPSAADQADDLARTIQNQWIEEAYARRLRDPGVLPLTWSATHRPVTDHPAAVVDSAGDATVRLRLRGHVEGDLEKATQHLAMEYRRIASGRLVVLGEPGSGKSVLAILLTLGLLGERTPGAAVPVLLSAASWDPTLQDMDTWLVHSIAKAYYQSQLDIPQRLLINNLLLPIVDGLDEILESARRAAVEHISRAVGVHRPVVITCRAREYEDLITGGAPMLRRAPTVEMAPVAADDLIAYFSSIDWPNGTDWAPVFTELRADPEAPVSAALTIPLTVSFARIVYQRLGGTPAALLDRARFESRHAVEDHLADQVVDAAYAPAADVNDANKPSWDGAQARRWLTFLATYMHRNHERDLAWWMLSQRLMSRWWAPAVGVVSGLVVLAAIFGWVALFDSDGDVGLYPTLQNGSLIAATFAAVVTVVWYAAAGRPPGALSFTPRGSMARLRSGFTIGLAAVAIPAGPVLAFTAVVISLGVGWSTFVADRYAQLTAATVALALCVGTALAAHSWLEAPPFHSVSVGPPEQVRQDRALSLVGALTVAVIVGAAALPGAALGSGLGSLVVGAATDWVGWPGRAEIMQVLVARFRDLTDLRFPGTAITVGVAVIIPGVLVGLLMLLTRAWPRFVLTRLWLAARGRLPWRLLEFLADARQREILRQRGGVYQFRHIRLQEQLATRQPIRDAVTSDVSSTAGQRISRAPMALGACALAATTIIALAALPPDTAAKTFANKYAAGPATLVLDTASTYMAAFRESDATVYIYDIATRNEVTRLPGNAGGVKWVEFAPGGRLIAVAAGGDTPEVADDAIRLWTLEHSDVSKPLVTMQPAPAYQTEISFSENSDAAFAATREADGLFINGWLWSSAAPLRTFSRVAGILDVIPSPTMTTVVTLNNRNTLELWSTASQEIPMEHRTAETGYRLGEAEASYSKDGRTVLLPPDDDRETWTLYDTISRSALELSDCVWPTFVAGGRKILCGGPSESAVLLDSRGAPMRNLGGGVVQQTDTIAVTESNDTITRLWSLERGAEILSFPGIYDDIDFSIGQDSQVVLVSQVLPGISHPRFELRDTRTGQVLADLSGDYNLNHNQYSISNVLLVAPTEPDRMLLWNRWLQSPVALDNFASSNIPIFGPGEYILADEGRDSQIRIRDLVSGRTIMQIDRAPRVLSDEVILSNDERSFFAFRTVDHIELRNRCNVGNISIGPLADTFEPAKFSTHGRLLAAAGADGTVRIWDAGTRELLRTLIGHVGIVVNMMFSKDDKTLVTSGEDGTIRMWNLTTLPEQYRNPSPAVC